MQISGTVREKDRYREGGEVGFYSNRTLNLFEESEMLGNDAGPINTSQVFLYHKAVRRDQEKLN